MDIKKLNSLARKEKSNSVDIDGYSFEFAILNGVELMRFANSLQKDPNGFIQLDIIFKTVTNYKGIKVKDIVDEAPEGFNMEDEVPFDRETFEIFLGRNQTMIVKLYEAINEKTAKYIAKQDEQKKT